VKIYFSHDLGEPRADVVRKHWLAQPDREDAGFFDALEWGEATLAGPPTIRGLLAKALDNTSVTCVLIGPETAGQRWVRYEIVQSIQRKNLLVGVHINGIPDRMQRTTARGKNPLEELAIAVADDGASIRVLHYRQNAWLPYQDNHGWKLAKPAPEHRRGKTITLSSFYRVYDWVADNGRENFDKWIGVTT
jgi:hypothetical protein